MFFFIQSLTVWHLYISKVFGSGVTTFRYPGYIKTEGYFSYSIGVSNRHRLPIIIIIIKGQSLGKTCDDMDIGVIEPANPCVGYGQRTDDLVVAKDRESQIRFEAELRYIGIALLEGRFGDIFQNYGASFPLDGGLITNMSLGVGLKWKIGWKVVACPTLQCIFLFIDAMVQGAVAVKYMASLAHDHVDILSRISPQPVEEIA